MAEVFGVIELLLLYVNSLLIITLLLVAYSHAFGNGAIGLHSSTLMFDVNVIGIPSYKYMYVNVV